MGNPKNSHAKKSNAKSSGKPRAPTFSRLGMIEYETLANSSRRCIEKINALKGSNGFYIGASSDPKERLDQHRQNKDFKQMRVLCHLKTKKATVELERHLINHYRGDLKFGNKPQLKADGTINYNAPGGGGEGLKGGENYIYVLLY